MSYPPPKPPLIGEIEFTIISYLNSVLALIALAPMEESNI
jgi:hypothetical protein